MKKILIINAYSVRNRGDAGIVIAMVRLLRRIWPLCVIDVMSSYSEKNANLYERYGCSSIPSVWQLTARRTALSRYIDGLRIVALSILRPRASCFAAFHNADLVISAGGGYLYSSAKGPLGVGLLCALCHYWLGYRTGKTTIGFPQSVGPILYTLDKILIGFVLRRARVIYSREAETTAVLKRMGVNTIEIPDIAFTLAPSFRNFDHRHGFRIGITVLDWRFSRRGANEKMIDDYLGKLASVGRDLLARFPSTEIFIFPQVDVGPGDSDLPISRRLESIVADERCRVFSLNDVATPEELVSVYSSVNLFLASRMHSAIFALAAGVPTIALAYQPKTTGTLSKVGLGNFARDIEAFDTQELLDMSMRLLGGQDYQELRDIDNIEKIISADLNG